MTIQRQETGQQIHSRFRCNLRRAQYCLPMCLFLTNCSLSCAGLSHCVFMVPYIPSFDSTLSSVFCTHLSQELLQYVCSSPTTQIPSNRQPQAKHDISNIQQRQKAPHPSRSPSHLHRRRASTSHSRLPYLCARRPYLKTSRLPQTDPQPTLNIQETFYSNEKPSSQIPP